MVFSIIRFGNPNNLAVAATITHMILWKWDTVKTAFGVYSLGRTQKILDPRTWNWRFWQQKEFNENREIPAHYDPHYRLMQAYTDVPNWWYSGTHHQLCCWPGLHLPG